VTFTWRPQKGPQEKFHASSVDEVFYGGAAGGGKTESLTVEPLRYVHVPGYTAIIFRRTYPELRQAKGIIARSRYMYPLLGGRYNEQSFTWRFPSGATIQFGQLEHEDDKYDHQSAEYAYIAFDELTTFTESQYLYLLSRLRSTAIDPVTGKYVPKKLRAASNPGNVGHEFVKSRFIDKLKPYEIKYFKRVDDVDIEADKDDPDALSRQFIPATLYDNLILMAADPQYEARLKSLSLIDRERLLSGNWDILIAGNVFKPEWFKIAGSAPEGLKWYRYWDLAASIKQRADFTASGAIGFDDSANLYIRDVVNVKEEWPTASKIMKSTIQQDYGIKEHGIEKKLHGLAAYQEFMNDKELTGFRIIAVDVQGDKLERAKVWSPRAEMGKVYLVQSPWNVPFINQCSLFDGTGVTHDDMVDSVSGGVIMSTQKKWKDIEFLHL